VRRFVTHAEKASFVYVRATYVEHKRRIGTASHYVRILRTLFFVLLESTGLQVRTGPGYACGVLSTRMTIGNTESGSD
jgi:hypothetical protein